MDRTRTDVPSKFLVTRTIEGELIVVDRDCGVAKTINDPSERDLWIHGLPEQSHAQFLKSFYPKKEAQS